MSDTIINAIRGKLETIAEKAPEYASDFAKRYINRGSKVAEAISPEAKQVVDGLHKVMESRRMMLGEYQAAREELVKNVDTANTDFHHNYEEYFTGKKQTTHPSQQAVIDFDKHANVGAYTHSQKIGIPVGNPNPDDWSRIWKPGSFDDKKAINHLVMTGQAKNEAEAQKLLDQYVRRSTGPRDANLRKSRKLDLPGYRKDILAPQDSMKHKVDDIAYSQVFGPKGEVMGQLKSAVRKKSYTDYQFLDKYIDTFMHREGVNYKSTEPWERGVNSLMTARFLGRTSIKHGSSVSNAVIFGEKLSPAIKAIGDMVGNWHDTKIDALRSGAIMSNSLDGMRSNLDLEMGRAGSWILKLTGFNASDMVKRVFASTYGRHLAQEVADDYIDTQSEKAGKKLLQLGIDPDKVLKDGLSEHDLLTAAQRTSDITQFNYNVEQLPMAWRDSPAHRLLTQYKPFVYMQSNFLKDHVIKPAMQGNVKPLILASILFPSVGEIVGDLSNLTIYGDLSRRPDVANKGYVLDRIASNMAYVGGFGVLTDIMYALSSPRESASYQLLAGPFISEIADTMNIAKAKDKGAAAISNVPIVGPYASQAMRGQKPHKPGFLEGGGLTHMLDKLTE